MLLPSFPLSLTLSLSLSVHSLLRFSECWSARFCRVSPQWRSSGKTSTGKWDCGAVLCALSLSLSPHLISPLSLFFPPSLSLSRSVRPSPPLYLSLPAGIAARTHKRMSEYTLGRTPSLVNTLAHRRKHTLTGESISKQRDRDTHTHTMEEGKGYRSGE